MRHDDWYLDKTIPSHNSSGRLVGLTAVWRKHGTLETREVYFSGTDLRYIKQAEPEA